ncbi:MAG: alpha/beta hydrolase [Proteobacteria bacterium]|nr:alpha/beta hydrolase [Pseudomonadota bacterium]
MVNYAPGVEDYIRVCKAIEPKDTYHYSIEQQRKNYIDFFRAFPIRKPESILVEEGCIFLDDGHRIPLRFYRRHDVDGTPPCIIYAHGGGYLSGDLEAADSIAADLADRLKVTVATFHYRIAPEHRHPAALEDTYATVQAIAERADFYRIDRNRLLLAGESCGGAFAAGIPLLIRDRGGHQLFGQVPINPILNIHRWALWQATEYPKDAQTEMNHYTSTYLGDNTEELVQYASPLLADDYSGMPRAFIWAAEIDPLADEARLYTERLKDAGVPCSLYIHEGVVHGSMRARQHYTFARKGFDVLVSGIKKLLGSD